MSLNNQEAIEIEIDSKLKFCRDALLGMDMTEEDRIRVAAMLRLTFVQGIIEALKNREQVRTWLLAHGYMPPSATASKMTKNRQRRGNGADAN